MTEQKQEERGRTEGRGVGGSEGKEKSGGVGER